MQLTEKKGLAEWYLARLRSLAVKQAGARLTPKALVQSDSQLIRDMVIKFSASRDDKTSQLLEEMNECRKQAQLFQHLLMLTLLIGIIAFVIVSFR